MTTIASPADERTGRPASTSTVELHNVESPETSRNPLKWAGAEITQLTPPTSHYRVFRHSVNPYAGLLPVTVFSQAKYEVRMPDGSVYDVTAKYDFKRVELRSPTEMLRYSGSVNGPPNAPFTVPVHGYDVLVIPRTYVSVENGLLLPGSDDVYGLTGKVDLKVTTRYSPHAGEERTLPWTWSHSEPATGKDLVKDSPGARMAPQHKWDFGVGLLVVFPIFVNRLKVGSVGGVLQIQYTNENKGQTITAGLTPRQTLWELVHATRRDWEYNFSREFVASTFFSLGDQNPLIPQPGAISPAYGGFNLSGVSLNYVAGRSIGQAPDLIDKAISLIPGFGRKLREHAEEAALQSLAEIQQQAREELKNTQDADRWEREDGSRTVPSTSVQTPAQNPDATTQPEATQQPEASPDTAQDPGTAPTSSDSGDWLSDIVSPEENDEDPATSPTNLERRRLLNELARLYDRLIADPGSVSPDEIATIVERLGRLPERPVPGQPLLYPDLQKLRELLRRIEQARTDGDQATLDGLERELRETLRTVVTRPQVGGGTAITLPVPASVPEMPQAAPEWQPYAEPSVTSGTRPEFSPLPGREVERPTGTDQTPRSSYGPIPVQRQPQQNGLSIQEHSTAANATGGLPDLNCSRSGPACDTCLGHMERGRCVGPDPYGGLVNDLCFGHMENGRCVEDLHDGPGNDICFGHMENGHCIEDLHDGPGNDICFGHMENGHCIDGDPYGGLAKDICFGHRENGRCIEDRDISFSTTAYAGGTDLWDDEQGQSEQTRDSVQTGIGGFGFSMMTGGMGGSGGGPFGNGNGSQRPKITSLCPGGTCSANNTTSGGHNEALASAICAQFDCTGTDITAQSGATGYCHKDGSCGWPMPDTGDAGQTLDVTYCHKDGTCGWDSQDGPSHSGTTPPGCQATTTGGLICQTTNAHGDETSCVYLQATADCGSTGADGSGTRCAGTTADHTCTLTYPDKRTQTCRTSSTGTSCDGQLAGDQGTQHCDFGTDGRTHCVTKKGDVTVDCTGHGDTNDHCVQTGGQDTHDTGSKPTGSKTTIDIGHRPPLVTTDDGGSEPPTPFKPGTEVTKALCEQVNTCESGDQNSGDRNCPPAGCAGGSADFDNDDGPHFDHDNNGPQEDDGAVNVTDPGIHLLTAECGTNPCYKANDDDTDGGNDPSDATAGSRQETDDQNSADSGDKNDDDGEKTGDDKGDDQNTAAQNDQQNGDDGADSGSQQPTAPAPPAAAPAPTPTPTPPVTPDNTAENYDHDQNAEVNNPPEQSGGGTGGSVR
jgi:hypothetical protein